VVIDWTCFPIRLWLYWGSLGTVGTRVLRSQFVRAVPTGTHSLTEVVEGVFGVVVYWRIWWVQQLLFQSGYTEGEKVPSTLGETMRVGVHIIARPVPRGVNT